MCIACKGGRLEPSTTEYVEKHGNFIIVIENIPCEECTQCGETYFSNEVMQKLEDILYKIDYISSALTVTVIDYAKSAA